MDGHASGGLQIYLLPSECPSLKYHCDKRLALSWCFHNRLVPVVAAAAAAEEEEEEVVMEEEEKEIHTWKWRGQAKAAESERDGSSIALLESAEKLR